MIQKIKNFLFNNTSVRQTIFKNTFWLAIAEAATKLLKLALLIYVAKILGATEYGAFSFAFAFVYMFAILADLGVGDIVVREFARDGKKEGDFQAIFSLKLLLNLLTIGLVFAASFLITADPEIRRLIWILAVYLLLDSFIFLFCCFFRARQMMQYEAFAKVVQALAVTGAGFLVLFKFPSAENFSYSYVFSGFAGLAFLFFLFLINKKYSFGFQYSRILWKEYLLMSWPLAMAGVLTMIYNQMDSVMMGYWGQITETGWYSAAYRLVGAALMVSGFISMSFYPALSKSFKESKESLQNIWNYHMEAMLLLALPVIGGGFFLASWIIEFIYDASYLPAVMAFQLLMLMAGICFVQSPFNHLLIATDQQKKLFRATTLGAIINVGLNLLLIPRFSLNGAAATTVFTWLVLLIVCFYFTYRYTPVNPFKFKFIIIKKLFIWRRIKKL